MEEEERCCDAYLQSVLDQSRDFVIAIDMRMIVQTFNKASTILFRELGVDLKKGFQFQQFLVSSPDKLESVNRARNGEKFSVLESWDNRLFQTEYAPLLDEKQTMIGVCLIGRSIEDPSDGTEPEEVKLQKEDREAFWPHVIVFSRDHHIRFISRQPSWEHFTGQNFEQYKGYGWLQAHHPDFRTRAWNIWQAVGASKKPRAFSFLSLMWNAQLKMYRNTLVQATPQHDTQGNVVYWNCAGIDIHEILQSQEELSVATQRLKMILEAGQVGTWEWDLSTNQVTGDKTHSQLFGREYQPHFLADELFSQVTPRSNEPIWNASLAAIEKGSTYDSEFEIAWPDGTCHWLGGRGELHISNDGRKSLLGVNWDITMRKQMEEERVRFLKHEEEIRASKQAEEFERKRAEEAEESQRRQEEFIDTVCHEIRNPLVGIYGGVHLATEEINNILSYLDLNCSIRTSLMHIRSFLTSILKCAEQQKVLVDDVLDMSKLQNNRIELVPIPFQLLSCFEFVIDMFRSRIKEKSLSLHTSVPEQIYVKADMHRLQQVIINLISNAVKFTHQGKIAITAEVIDQ